MGNNNNHKKLYTKAGVLEAGFVYVRDYKHDQYTTERYEAGPITLELTYEEGAIVSSDICIEETEFFHPLAEDLKKLVEILSKVDEQ